MQQPPGYPPPTPDYEWVPREPENSAGLAGFILSVTSIGLLISFFGFSAPLSACLSIAGMVFSYRGIGKVERGETSKRKDMSQWGFWLGFVGLILAVLAGVGLVLLIEG